MMNLQPAWQMALEANFGSVQRWHEDFLACANNASGAGSVALCFVPSTGMLVNQWLISDLTNAVDAVPLLTLEKTTDLSDLSNVVDWSAPYQRYQDAVHTASEPWSARAENVVNALVLDVRRASVFEKASTMLPGAQWRDPALVATWCQELPTTRELVVYCVYGHEVSRGTTLRLRAAGLNARYLEGGIDAWQQAGQALIPKV
jgi:superoxide dismutase, Fe-Mn family